MRTVYRESDLLSEKKELERKIQSLQSKRAQTLKKFQSRNSQDLQSEREDLQLKLENVEWKLKALF